MPNDTRNAYIADQLSMRSGGNPSVFDPMELVKQELLARGTTRLTDLAAREDAYYEQLRQRTRLRMRAQMGHPVGLDIGPAQLPVGLDIGEAQPDVGLDIGMPAVTYADPVPSPPLPYDIGRGVSEADAYGQRDMDEVAASRAARLAGAGNHASGDDWTREDMVNEAAGSVFNEHLAPHSFAGLTPGEIAMAVAKGQEKEAAYQYALRRQANDAENVRRMAAMQRTLATGAGVPPEATLLLDESGEPAKNVGPEGGADPYYRKDPHVGPPTPSAPPADALDELSFLDRWRMPVY